MNTEFGGFSTDRSSELGVLEMQNRSRYPSAMLQWRSVFERERGKKEEEEGSSGSVMGIRTIPPNPYQFISFSFKKKKAN